MRQAMIEMKKKQGASVNWKHLVKDNHTTPEAWRK